MDPEDLKKAVQLVILPRATITDAPPEDVSLETWEGGRAGPGWKGPWAGSQGLCAAAAGSTAGALGKEADESQGGCACGPGVVVGVVSSLEVGWEEHSVQSRTGPKHESFPSLQTCPAKVQLGDCWAMHGTHQSPDAPT